MIHQPEYECMSRDRRYSLQSWRLRETVDRMYRSVPLYRKRMQEAGLKPSDIRCVDDLVLLPFMDKEDLRKEFPFGLLAAPQSEIVRIQGSSGTTGHPIVSGYTAWDVEAWTDMVARALCAAGADKSDIVQVGYGYGLFTGGLGAHQGATKIGAMVVPMSAGNTKRQIMMMRELGSTMLCCTPSYAIYLGETAREMGLKPGRDFSLKSGCFGAEPWTQEMRLHIEELLGINAYDIYGLTEIAGPGVAFECSCKNGMHVNEDHVIVEVIDPDTGNPQPCGMLGELVFTTISKTGQPMIRYRTHDICSLDTSPCACGRTSARISRIMGRTDDMLVIRGVNVFPSQIETVLMSVEGVSPHYEILVDRIDSSDMLTVRSELATSLAHDGRKDDGMHAIQKQIERGLKSVIGLKAIVELVEPKTLPRSEGKAKRVVDRRKL